MLLVSDGSLPLVHAEFRYRYVDPFAVQLRLSLGRFQAVSWTFGRDLLIAGIRYPSGIGDVRIYPCGDGVLIELRSTTDPHALLLADRLHIEQFLHNTLSIVPIGSEIEHYDVDADLIRLGTEDTHTTAQRQRDQRRSPTGHLRPDQPAPPAESERPPSRPRPGRGYRDVDGGAPSEIQDS